MHYATLTTPMTALRFFLLAVLLSTSLWVEAQWDAHGQFRSRLESRKGYKSLLSDETVLAFRNRLNLSYAGQNVLIRISPQLVAQFPTQMPSEPKNQIMLYEGLLEIEAGSLSIILGRQELSYDNQRLLSPKDWSNSGNTFDALVVAGENTTTDFHFGLSLGNQWLERSVVHDCQNNYAALSFFWLRHKLNTATQFSLLSLTDAFCLDSGSDQLYFSTTNGGTIRVEGTEKFDFEGEAYMQTGDSRFGARLNAWMIALNLTFELSERIESSLLADYYSGAYSRPFRRGQSSTFDNLFGAGHRFLGTMDYITNTTLDTRGAGVVDLSGVLDLSLTENTSFSSACHLLQLAGYFVDYQSDYPTLIEPPGRYVGTELAFCIKHEPYDNLSLQAGYTLFPGTETLNAMKAQEGAPLNTWAWATVVFFPGRPTVE